MSSLTKRKLRRAGEGLSDILQLWKTCSTEDFMDGLETRLDDSGIVLGRGVSCGFDLHFIEYAKNRKCECTEC